MKDSDPERWQQLCSEISKEQNSQRMSHMIAELLEEFRKRDERLNARQRNSDRPPEPREDN